VRTLPPGIRRNVGSGAERALSLLRPPGRYRYGTEFCGGDRLPKDALEEAVIEQMEAVYRDSSLIEEALADWAVKDGEPVQDAARRLAGIRQELAGAKRSLDRYFAAFEEGSLSPADCQERIAELKARIDAMIAEEATLTRRASEGATEATSPVDVAEWAKDLGTLLRAGTVQQRKALFRLLVKELRVVSRDEILPTYKIPALVRAPEGQVDLGGRYSNSTQELVAQFHDLIAYLGVDA
jgi:site-specific DNA recombinase